MPVMEPGWRGPPQGFHPRRAAPAHARVIVDTGTSRQEELPLRRNEAPLFNPVSAAWNTVARFDDYQAAQRAVDRLSDDGMPAAG